VLAISKRELIGKIDHATYGTLSFMSGLG